MNRDVIRLLVHHLDPKSALELRRCNRQLNRWIAHDQLYWYYQLLGYDGRKYGHARNAKEMAAAGAQRVHTKQWSVSCINNRGYCTANHVAAYDWLVEHHPRVKGEMLEEARKKQELYPYLSSEKCEMWGKRYVCIRNYQALDHKFCGREDHFSWAFGEKAVIGNITEDFLAAKADGNLLMFKFLFQCYRDTRKTVARIKSEERADALAQALRDKLVLLESQIQETKKELAVMENFSSLKEAVKISIFNRKNEKSYQERKEVKRTF